MPCVNASVNSNQSKRRQSGLSYREATKRYVVQATSVDACIMIRWAITRKMRTTPEARKKYHENVSNPPPDGRAPNPVEIRIDVLLYDGRNASSTYLLATGRWKNQKATGPNTGPITK